MASKNYEDLIEKVENLIEKDVLELGLTLVDVEYLQDGGYWYLRIYIERDEKEIDLEDCVALSNRIDEKVDNIVKEKFFLEVSSPGLERPLKKESDYTRFQGSKVRLILKHKLEDSRNWKGIIKEYKDGTIYLESEKKTIEIPYNEVKKANLVFEFEDF